MGSGNGEKLLIVTLFIAVIAAFAGGVLTGIF
jgi:hypothetical protein